MTGRNTETKRGQYGGRERWTDRQDKQGRET